MPHKNGTTLLIESIPELFETVIEFPNFAYARGEPKEYDIPFLPKVWRKDPVGIDDTPLTPNTTFTKGELKILEQCQKDLINKKFTDSYFTTFIDDYKKKIDLNNEDLFHWTALAQHYDYPTRLTDITTDLLVALYFACSKCIDNSGYVYYFKDNYNELHLSDHVRRVGSYFDVEEIKSGLIDKYPKTPIDDTPTIIKPSYPNKRIETQRGAFCF
uniref:FRG domain-containing protein n=1 Tax=uncultured Eudoraea sp. TaxID=1035614 RepID=UPI00261C560C